MKRKIVGICICMLLIATAIPAVTSVKNNAIDATTPKTAQPSMTGGWIETQKLLASDGGPNDNFATLVDLSGDTALFSAPLDDANGTDSGSAYIFTKTDNNWTQQAKLLASDETAGDEFGFSIALDGNTALIGAIFDDDNGIDSGSAYVFVRTGTTWTQQVKLLPLDGGAGDHFGYRLDLQGDTAIIGANWDSDLGNKSGSAYVFTRSGTTWTQTQKLLAADGQAGDRFGGYIALQTDTAIIGAYWDDDNGIDSGSAYVFTRSETTWTQTQKLLASDGAAGDAFGAPICIDGNTILIGAYADDDNGTDSGSAYVFIKQGTAWTEQQKITASDGATDDRFSGDALSLDDDTAIIGACNDDDFGINSGSAYVFTRTGTTWIEQQKLHASDGAAGDQFCTVALSGDTAIITSWYDDDLGLNSGSAYVFTKTGLTFSIAGGLGVKAVITNDGTMDVNDIAWQIHVEGGMLGMVNKTVNGTIDIPAGKSVTVKTGLLLGFGAISIIANVAGEEQTAEGTQLIIFSFV